MPLRRDRLAAYLDLQVNGVRLSLAGSGWFMFHPISQVIKSLSLAAAIRSPHHHLWDLRINECPLDLVFHALVKLCATEIKTRIVWVDLRVNREAIPIPEAKPIFE